MTNTKIQNSGSFEGERYGQGGTHRGFQSTGDPLVLKLQDGYRGGCIPLSPPLSPRRYICMNLTLIHTPLNAYIFLCIHHHHNFSCGPAPGPTSLALWPSAEPSVWTLVLDWVLAPTDSLPHSKWQPLKTQHDGLRSPHGLTWSTYPGHRGWEGKLCGDFSLRTWCQPCRKGTWNATQSAPAFC